MDGDRLREFFPDHADFAITSVSTNAGAVTVEAIVTIPTAECPSCGCPSDRVHGRYTRRINDQPCRGRELFLVITARKFVCLNSNCPRAIFCERLPSLAAAHARMTDPLTESHRAIGFSIGGEPGARLSRRLDMPTSPDTLLPRVKSAPQNETPSPRFVGVDDWAYKKGHNYGTILIDLERRCVINILPGRDGEALKVWLSDHPTVEVISRDRWSAFAQAAAEAAPQAKQVADRWHLLKNLREAVERLFERRSGAVKDVIGTPPPSMASIPTACLPTEPIAQPDALPSPESAPRSARQETRRAKRQRRVDRFEQVRHLNRQGFSIRRISQMTGVTRKAVRRYLCSERCPDWQPGRERPKQLDRLRDEIDRRIQAGCDNAAEIHRILTAQGCRASYYAVCRFVARRMAALGKPRSRAEASTIPACRPPSARRLTFELFRRAENRKPEEQARLASLHQVEEFREALELTDQFVSMIRKQFAQPLYDWIAQAEQSTCPELRGFAKGIRQDQAAVDAAMKEQWSNGPVEGAVNRLKMIKRQMFGRAGFPLLRVRVRQAA